MHHRCRLHGGSLLELLSDAINVEHDTNTTGTANTQHMGKKESVGNSQDTICSCMRARVSVNPERSD